MVASNCEEEFVMKASLWVSAGIKMVNFSHGCGFQIPWLHLIASYGFCLLYEEKFAQFGFTRFFHKSLFNV